MGRLKLNFLFGFGRSFHTGYINQSVSAWDAELEPEVTLDNPAAPEVDEGESADPTSDVLPPEDEVLDADDEVPELEVAVAEEVVPASTLAELAGDEEPAAAVVLEVLDKPELKLEAPIILAGLTFVEDIACTRLDDMVVAPVIVVTAG